tara:strand:+ start:328 stop:594 length:267 start_codon:yes stop_codon:yes gene_type:complete
MCYTNRITNEPKEGKMATKDTQYKFHTTVTMPSGKIRHLFTNDTVSRTKVLLKAGVDMGGVNWIALDEPKTKEQVLSAKLDKTTISVA